MLSQRSRPAFHKAHHPRKSPEACHSCRPQTNQPSQRAPQTIRAPGFPLSSSRKTFQKLHSFWCPAVQSHSPPGARLRPVLIAASAAAVRILISVLFSIRTLFLQRRRAAYQQLAAVYCKTNSCGNPELTIFGILTGFSFKSCFVVSLPSGLVVEPLPSLTPDTRKPESSQKKATAEARAFPERVRRKPAGSAIAVAIVVMIVVTVVPSAVAPVAATPTAELRAIHRTALAVLKQAGLSVRPARVDAQRLDLPRVGIDPEGAVAHAERAIRTRQLAQAIGHVDVVPPGPILGVQELVLA